MTKSDPMSIEDVMSDIMDGCCDNHPDDLKEDNDGQLVIYTGIYRWADGTYHEDQETS